MFPSRMSVKTFAFVCVLASLAEEGHGSSEHVSSEQQQRHSRELHLSLQGDAPRGVQVYERMKDLAMFLLASNNAASNTPRIIDLAAGKAPEDPEERKRWMEEEIERIKKDRRGQATDNPFDPGYHNRLKREKQEAKAEQAAKAEAEAAAARRAERIKRWTRRSIFGVVAVVLQQVLVARGRVLEELRGELEVEIQELQKLTVGKVWMPTARSLREQREALAELNARKAVLQQGVLPKLKQLRGESYLENVEVEGKPLSERTSGELNELDKILTDRIERSRRLLSEYETIGQMPPQDLHTWSLDQVCARLNDMTSKREELMEVVQLYKKLQQDVDPAIFEWDVERLREHVVELSDKVKWEEGMSIAEDN